MATAYTSTNRNAEIKIGNKGPFIVTKVTYIEDFSVGAKMEIDFAADASFDQSDMGQQVIVNHTTASNEKVNFCLISSSLDAQGYSQEKKLGFYKLTAEDPLSLLKHTKDSRVFQKKSTKEIIETIFSEAGLKKYLKISAGGEGKKQDFRLQFQETGYDFIRRLCSEEGWHFYCTHKNAVQLVITDKSQSYDKFSGGDISFLNPTKDIPFVLTSWENILSLGTGNVNLRGFSFKNAQTFDNTSKSSISDALKLSIFDNGIGAQDKAEISGITDAVQKGFDFKKQSCVARTAIETLTTGMKFNFKNHPEKSFNQEYLIIGIRHYLIANESGQDNGYHNEIVCVPSKVAFAPTYLPKPQFFGTLTATVTGPSDSEIHTDGKGNIRVLLHFDREGKEDENSSVWIPVAQSFTGNGFGSLVLPRVGTTVVITFMNGNIDTPLVISSVYNEKQKLPFSKASQLGIKTHSHPHGDQNSCNELRFDDQKDNEQVYIHAQKDLLCETENDLHENIKGSQETVIEKKLTTSAKEEVQHSTEKTYTITSKDKISINTDTDLNETIKGQAILTANGGIQQKTDKDLSQNVTGSIKVDGKDITITGKSNITLKVGGSKIEISSFGITISGTSITIKGTNTKIDATKLDAKGSASANLSGAQVKIKADANAELSGLITDVKASTMATVQGSAMLTLKGGLTRIN